ncbi:MAG: DUF4829 domain-containing protein [Caldiserica bacterium]|jgi:hypothetical protein|nr:DUF4829 domain-containing protein [Caldisericota bacterium]MDH7561900.1 hypothetical protein [Caldisericota bacterium]
MGRVSFIPLLLVFFLGLTSCSPKAESPSLFPSQVVEEFFSALDRKDYQKAYSLLVQDFQEQMPLEIFSSSIEQGLSEYNIISQTWQILGEEVNGDLARVSYKITSSTQEGKKIEGQGVYILKKERDGWKIDLSAVTP